VVFAYLVSLLVTGFVTGFVIAAASPRLLQGKGR
jgi:hypothetical protein